jgi:predicted O-methyltransferase YrrM
LDSLYYLLAYFFKKEDRHSLQSPFAFQIYDGLIRHRNTASYPEIEKIRRRFLQNEDEIQIEDYGVGSKKLKTSSRKVKDVARYSNSPKKFNLLYQYFLSKTPAQTAIELGTGLGINAQYLAQALKGKLYTLEGDKGLYELAAEHLQLLPGVEPRNEQFDEGLPKLLEEIHHVDFALLDGNHSYSATLHYFNSILPYLREESILIIGDIYWSKGMKKAWKEIQAFPQVTMSFDFYECGVLFFKPNITKDHYILTY